jgi:Flp pilus assembly protein TadG
MLVLIALAIVVLIGMTGLVLDLGYMYSVRAQLQNAADSAALAGASGLDGSTFYNQTSARIRAQHFAQQNNAAGSPVLLDLNTTTNSKTGDIVIGCWDKIANDMNTSCTRPNSVQVNARRSIDAGVGPTPVSTFLGKILNIHTVNIRTTAVAQRPSKPTVPLAICSPPGTGACDLSGPFTFYFHESSHPPEWTTGWTEFSADSKATDLGPNSTIAQLIQESAQIPANVCNKTIWTNTGTGVAIKVLQDTYDLKKDPITGRWDVILPIFDICPSASQPGEKFNTLVRYAHATVTSVISTGTETERSFTVENLSCMDCSTSNFLGDTVQLIK